MKNLLTRVPLLRTYDFIIFIIVAPMVRTNFLMDNEHVKIPKNIPECTRI
jgi:hypothetical protein